MACNLLTEAADDEEGAILEAEGAESIRGAARLVLAAVPAAALVERAALAVALVDKSRRIGNCGGGTKNEEKEGRGQGRGRRRTIFLGLGVSKHLTMATI